MVLPPHLAAQAALVAPLCEALALYLELAQDGVIVLVYQAETEGLCRLVQGLAPAHPYLDVLDDAPALEQAPEGAVVLLRLTDEDLTSQGTWLNLHRTLFAERRLRVILWCEGDVHRRLALLAPDFVDWVSHRLPYPETLRGQPPAHLIGALRALVRARAPGAVCDGMTAAGVEALVRAALPSWRVAHVHGAYDDLVRGAALPGRIVACFDALDETTRQRIPWALSEARRRRPSLILDGATPGETWPRGLWSFGGDRATIRQARDLLSGMPAPGQAAALLGLETEAIQLCAALRRQDRALDDAALCRELAAAADPGAVVARRALAAGVPWDVPPLPLLRALCGCPGLGSWQHAQARLDPEEALAQGDVVVAIRWGGPEVLDRARALIARRLGPQPGPGPTSPRRLRVLHAARDRGYAEELATLLSLLGAPLRVSLRPRDAVGDAALVLLSAELLADDQTLAELQRLRDARRPVFLVVLRACDWEIAPPLRGLSPLSLQPLTTWQQPELFWTSLLRHVRGWLAGPR